MIHPLQILKNRLRNRKRQKQFLQEFLAYQKMSNATQERFPVLWQNRFPQLSDKTATTAYDRHYVLHTAWAARVLAATKPTKHVDISSSLYFSAIASAFVPIDFYDYRPAKINLSNLSSKAGDLMALPFKDDSVASISCMHTVEHIGLGRYGDTLDPDGDLKAIRELKRVTAPGGNLLFVTPIGQPKLMFNAHRIYSYDQIRQYFTGFKLQEFALIPDRLSDQPIVLDASKELADQQVYGCGCFWFTKNK